MFYKPCSFWWRGRCGPDHDGMLVVFTTIYAISQCLPPLTLRVRTPLMVRCIRHNIMGVVYKVCQ
jgi:hypothetical protein